MPVSKVAIIFFIEFILFFYVAMDLNYELVGKSVASKHRLSLKEFGVSYHSTLKKILSVPKFLSNHFVCMQLNT